MVLNVAQRAVFVTVLLLFYKMDASKDSSCPCSDAKWCERITKQVNKEVLVWNTKNDVWQHYNWSVVTTVAIFNDWNNDLMCYAHSKVGARWFG